MNESAFMSFDILRILILFGGLQGFILGVILITTPRFQRKSNYFLAGLLFNLALLNFTSVAELTLPRQEFPHLSYTPTFIVLTIPLFTFYFVKFLIEPHYEMKKKDLFLFLPAIWELCHRVIRYISFLISGPMAPADLHRFYFISNIYETIAVVSLLVIIVYSIKQLRAYEQNLYDNYSEVEGKSLSWLRMILVSGVVLATVWMIVTIADFKPEVFLIDLTLGLLLGLSILIYWIGYTMIIRQELLETPIFAISAKNSKNSETSDLSAKTDDHYRRILEMMEEDQLFKDPNLNMSVLSQKTGLSNGYLSQIINSKREENFFDFVNSYRIKDVQLKMNDPTFNHYTILGIAQEAGFKSKSTFNAVFKKSVGMTPSEYKKSL